MPSRQFYRGYQREYFGFKRRINKGATGNKHYQESTKRGKGWRN